MNLEVQVMLDCTHSIFLPVENVMLVPKRGDKIVCASCKEGCTVIHVGVPYPVNHYEAPVNPDQRSMEE